MAPAAARKVTAKDAAKTRRGGAPPARESAAAPKPETIAAGLRAFFAIMAKWRVRNDDMAILLGRPSKSTLHNWKNGDVGAVAHGLDLATRLSLVLGIFKALDELYADPAQADAWVRRPNTAFGGQSALDRMLAGQITDLAAVRDYLDGIRTG